MVTNEIELCHEQGGIGSTEFIRNQAYQWFTNAIPIADRFKTGIAGDDMRIHSAATLGAPPGYRREMRAALTWGT
jgi:hypothetical protein